MTPHEKQTVILYHGKCVDGFGAAYAAWKKLGAEAEYIPVSYGKPLPEKMEGRDVFFVDFCPEADELEAFSKGPKSITILDHHHGMQSVATRFPGIFDPSHSGATLSWEYFHPNEPVPALLTYVEDGDLYRYSLPETRDVYSALIVEPYDFARWDEIAKTLDDPAASKTFLEKASAFTEYFEKLSDLSVAGTDFVRFEGYECPFAVTHPTMTMKSYVGHLLYTKYPPIALIVSAHPNGFGVSIRGNGSVDVSKIAAKYGGNGMHDAAGFFVPANKPLPWTEITHEDSRH